MASAREAGVPVPDKWYTIKLGTTLSGTAEDETNKKKKRFRSLRYEFKPASMDASRQQGTLHKSKDNKVTVEFSNNNQSKPNKLTFQGTGEDCKDLDAILFLDAGTDTFTLERLHKAVKCLRYVRLPDESSSLIPEAKSPPPAKPPKGANFRPLPPTVPVAVEKIDNGEPSSSSPVEKKNGKRTVDEMNTPSPLLTSEPKTIDEDEHADIDIDVEEDVDVDVDVDVDAPVEDHMQGKHEEIIYEEVNINIDDDLSNGHNSSSEESGDVDLSDDNQDEGTNAAEALRAQVNAETNDTQQSSSSNDSSGSGSSGSGSTSSSSDSEGSDDDSASSGHDDDGS